MNSNLLLQIGHKLAFRVQNLLNIRVIKPLFLIGNWKKNQVFQNFIKQQKIH